MLSNASATAPRGGTPKHVHANFLYWSRLSVAHPWSSLMSLTPIPRDHRQAEDCLAGIRTLSGLGGLRLRRPGLSAPVWLIGACPQFRMTPARWAVRGREWPLPADCWLRSTLRPERNLESQGQGQEEYRREGSCRCSCAPQSPKKVRVSKSKGKFRLKSLAHRAPRAYRSRNSWCQQHASRPHASVAVVVTRAPQRREGGWVIHVSWYCQSAMAGRSRGGRAMISERDGFGPALKAERVRRGITLRAIADSTKIGISLLAALERNDMSRWPKGIFRRAFVREYVSALGLPPEPIVAEFARLFPDAPCPEAAEAPQFRLMLDSEPSVPWAMWRSRVVIASIEVLGVVLMGALLAWLLDAQLAAACGGVALLYYPVASVCLERGPRLRLSLPPVGARWLRAPAKAIGHLRFQWSKRAPLDGLDDLSATQEANETTTAAPAAEWHTAPN